MATTLELNNVSNHALKNKEIKSIWNNTLRPISPDEYVWLSGKKRSHIRYFHTNGLCARIPLMKTIIKKKHYQCVAVGYERHC